MCTEQRGWLNASTHIQGEEKEEKGEEKEEKAEEKGNQDTAHGNQAQSVPRKDQ